MDAGKDPYLQHYFRVDFDGGNLTRLTQADAWHDVAFSSDMAYYLDTYSRVDLPPVSELRRADGSLVSVIERADIRALLGSAVNCPAIATTISNKCVFSVCVGHRAELLEVCERGLDEVVGIARSKMEALRFDAIRLEAGAATLADLAADGTAARLTGGVWTAQIDASQGLRPVPATFTAAR